MSATPGRASPTRCAAGCSSRSSPPSRSGRAPAWGSTCRGGSWSSATVATCGSPPRRGTPASRWSCPSPSPHRPRDRPAAGRGGAAAGRHEWRGPGPLPRRLHRGRRRGRLGTAVRRARAHRGVGRGREHRRPRPHRGDVRTPLRRHRGVRRPGHRRRLQRGRDVHRHAARRAGRRAGHPGLIGVFDVDWMGLLTREVLRERAAELIADSCAWAVGMSDQPHYQRRAGRVVATGTTVGERAAKELLLGDEEDGRLDLGDARPGSFQDALNAVGADGVLQAHRFDEELLQPFVQETCLRAADRARSTRPEDWAELADDVGEDAQDIGEVVRGGGWEAPLRIDAEHLVLAALGAVPLIEVEAEGLPLSLVRAAETVTRGAAEPTPPEWTDDALAGSLFLAEAAVTAAGASLPVAPDAAERLVEQLLAHGLEADEVLAVLPHL